MRRVHIYVYIYYVQPTHGTARDAMESVLGEPRQVGDDPNARGDDEESRKDGGESEQGENGRMGTRDAIAMPFANINFTS